jgi:hypothetical protein
MQCTYNSLAVFGKTFTDFLSHCFKIATLYSLSKIKKEMILANAESVFIFFSSTEI